MSDPQAVTIPLLNANEPEALIAELLVANGDEVAAGAELALIETTKASAMLVADRGGYVCGLQAQPGQTLPAGRVLLWIAEAVDWAPPEPAPEEQAATGFEGGLKISQPARALAEEAGLALEELPTDVFITEQWLKSWLESQGELPPVDEEAIVVYGAGGHGKAVVELIQALGDYRIEGFIDDGLSPGEEVMGLPVLGGAEVLGKYRARGIGQAANAVGGIGDIRSRVQVAKRLRAVGYSLPTLVHPTAFVEASAQLATGVQVFPLAYVGSQAQLANGVIVNTAAVVSHDCRLDQHANIAPGSLLAGAVEVGEFTLVGMGVTINLEAKIGRNCRIGNSAVIKQSVPEGSVVPAGSLWPPQKPSEVHA